MSLDCFECNLVDHSEYVPNRTLNLCDNFDHSEQFVKKCDGATMCRKTVITANIAGARVGIERDCVSGVYNVQVDYNPDGTWSTNNEAVPVTHTEGCTNLDGYGIRNVEIKNCYCSTDLCNSGVSLSIASFMMFLCYFIFCFIY